MNKMDGERDRADSNMSLTLASLSPEVPPISSGPDAYIQRRGNRKERE
jgi:hypothetical protein